MQREMFWHGLLCRRQVVAPTWRGWLLLLTLAGAAGWTLLRVAHPFLAINAPIAARVAVVEGWAPDHVLHVVAEEVRQGHYDQVYVTGIPIERGAPLSQHHTYAELGAATLVALGVPAEKVQAVPTPAVQRDRTYLSALSLRLWLEEHHSVPDRLNVVTVGLHARRSHLFFRQVFKGKALVGVVSMPDRDYDARRWWRYSAGLRGVIGEGVGYLHARLFSEKNGELEASVRARRDVAPDRAPSP